jgi:putative addiction module CopG family antidote
LLSPAAAAPATQSCPNSEAHSFADVLRLGTAALRWWCQDAPDAALVEWQSSTAFAMKAYTPSVKAVTINISLNPELAEFARADSAAGAYDSMSEYMRELIRRRRETRIAEEVALLEKAMEGAPLGDPSDADLRHIYAVAKQGREA